jgi:hypothetical protein
MSTLVSTENLSASLATKFINQTSRHIFLTGKAGTGKTTFLKYIIQNTHKKAVIAAPTGIAAINAGGVTLHSLFQLPFGAFVPSKEKTTTVSNGQRINNPYTLITGLKIMGLKRRLIQEIELLIIDEVSMLRADLLDAIDTVLRTIRRNPSQPFGGVQLLFIGDLLQLPPVVKDDEWQAIRGYYKSPHFFEAHALQNQKPVYIELEKIYRQQDEEFIHLLNNLRDNKVTREDIQLLNQYYKPSYTPEKNENIIRLTTHNYKANQINESELKKLAGKTFSYHAEITGDFNEHAYPIEAEMVLKVGAQVMFIKNDPSGGKRFFNGKIGKISALTAENISVVFEEGDEVEVEKYLWENKKYSVNDITNEVEEQIIGKFLHYPLKLAWAITVHKSQGLTFEKAIIDVGDAFAPGQVYVALSRLTSLKGLALTSPVNLDSLTEDQAIAKFAENKNPQQELQQILEKEKASYVKDFTVSCFNFSPLVNHLQRHIESFGKDDKKSAKEKFAPFAKELKIKLEEQKVIADKFMNQLLNLFATNNPEYTAIRSRVSSAFDYFSPIIKDLNKQILSHIERVKLENKVKKYLTELQEIDAMFFKLLQQMARAKSLITSAIENSELPMNGYYASLNKERSEKLGFAKESEKNTRNIKQGKKGNPEKGQSQKESLQHYLNGKTIEEIATLRAMSPLTIEGHLAQCVAEGKIKATVFISTEKIEQIVVVSEKLGTTGFNAIKQALGDEFTYSDIKFAMAHFTHTKNEFVE